MREDPEDKFPLSNSEYERHRLDLDEVDCSPTYYQRSDTDYTVRVMLYCDVASQGHGKLVL